MRSLPLMGDINDDVDDNVNDNFYLPRNEVLGLAERKHSLAKGKSNGTNEHEFPYLSVSSC